MRRVGAEPLGFIMASAPLSTGEPPCTTVDKNVP